MAIVWVIHVIQYIKYDVQGDRPPPAQMQLPRYLQQPQVQQPQYPQQPLPPQQQPPPMQYPPPQQQYQQAPNAPNANLAGAYGNNTAATTYFGGGTSSQQPTGLGLGPAKPHKPGYEAASASACLWEHRTADSPPPEEVRGPLVTTRCDVFEACWDGAVGRSGAQTLPTIPLTSLQIMNAS